MTAATPAVPPIALSSGEPAGIGPDICVRLAAEACPARLGVLGDPDVLAERARVLGLDVTVRTATPETLEPHAPGTLQVLPVRVRAAVVPGRLDPANAPYVLELLERGVDLCLRGAVRALVTAPVQKSVINEAGVPFSGHTEFLAERTGAPQPVMLLAGRRLRVALATTHLPLRAVADALDASKLESLIRITHRGLERLFGIASPRLLVLGLNPHAGEHGVLGDEERRVIGPVIERLAAEGLAVRGPASADTAFTPDSLREHDAVIAMYHDQGLPVLKALEFGEIVNVTLGLPIVRTSVDHGTALALAGTGRARHESLRAAVALAIELAERAAA
ncbi:MAG TPA: 4-hydroxythreonine-4-phosphate dehydrogenase PdxA [Gammaproteobacteria bacterium]